MLKSFIEHIQETTKPVIYQDGKTSFVITSGGEIEELRAEIDRPSTLELNSLDSMVKLIQSEAYHAEEKLYITVPNHLTVRCFGQPQPDARFFRQTYYEAKATDVPGWEEKVQFPFEEMQIALRTRFQETPDTLYTRKLLSEISTGAKVTFNDNGVATTIVTKKGIDLQANETIKPIVTLRPYRTFQEIDQPESIFLIRISERGISFIEADGGMWKLNARKTIAEFLEDKLSSLVSMGKVIIAL